MDRSGASGVARGPKVQTDRRERRDWSPPAPNPGDRTGRTASRARPALGWRSLVWRSGDRATAARVTASARSDPDSGTIRAISACRALATVAVFAPDPRAGRGIALRHLRWSQRPSPVPDRSRERPCRAPATTASIMRLVGFTVVSRLCRSLGDHRSGKCRCRPGNLAPKTSSESLCLGTVWATSGARGNS
jgi:hypothetical protein